MSKIRISSLLDDYGDGIHGTPVYSDTGEYFFINGNNLSNGRIQVSNDTLKIREKEYQKIRRPLNEKTLLISINGTLGNMALYRGEKVALGKSACYLNATSIINRDYIRWVLSTSAFRKYMLQVAHGSTIKNLAPSQIAEYEFENVQNVDCVVGLLNVLDNKIDLNTRLCAELEAMAKTLYEYWFVQFDFPDENGKPYCTSGGAMELCQELHREVPKGWRAGRYCDLIEGVRTGLNPRQNFSFSEGGIRYLTVKNLTQEGRIDFTGCDMIDEIARKIVHRRSDISVGDVLFASIAPLGRCFLIQSVPNDWDINESVFSLRPNYENCTPEFLYMTLKSDQFIAGSTNSSTGSIFKGIRINTLMDMITVVPPISVLKLFSAQVSSILRKQESLFSENELLTHLRDWLLPMLMNGQAIIHYVK